MKIARITQISERKIDMLDNNSIDDSRDYKISYY